MPPLPVTVSVKVSVSSAAGAVKLGRAVVQFPAPCDAPAVWDHECVTLLPQGSSYPAAASAAPRVTLAPCTTSIPPFGPALATGTKRALPGLPCSERVVRPVRFSKIRDGSDRRPLPCSRSTVSVSSSPSNTPAGSDVSSLLLRVHRGDPAEIGEVPRLERPDPPPGQDQRSA